MKKIINLALALCLLSSALAHAGLTSMCSPEQPLGANVSYIDKFHNDNLPNNVGAPSNFDKNVQVTLKGTSASVFDMFKPSQIKFNWLCDGPCTFESEASFMRLQRGVKIKAIDVFNNTNKYLTDVSDGRNSEEIFVGLRNEMKFDGFFNAKKIPADITRDVDSLLSQAKATGVPFTRTNINSIPRLKRFFSTAYSDNQYLIDALKKYPKKPFIVNLTAFDKNGAMLSGHSINVISEGSAPESKLIVISNGEISSSMDFKNVTQTTLTDALKKTLGNDRKITSITFDMFWE